MLVVLDEFYDRTSSTSHERMCLKGNIIFFLYTIRKHVQTKVSYYLMAIAKFSTRHVPFLFFFLVNLENITRLLHYMDTGTTHSICCYNIRKWKLLLWVICFMEQVAEIIFLLFRNLRPCYWIFTCTFLVD